MLRLTSGLFRGRSIETLSGDSTRPTQARLRQAWLNSIQAHLPGANVLELFAGSGALGFEALSRGAQNVDFVESLKAAAQVIEKNSIALQIKAQTRIFNQKWEDCLPQVLARGAPYDLIFADPPYFKGFEMQLLETVPWSTALAPDGLFCLEWATSKQRPLALPEKIGTLVKVREKSYGDSFLTTYQQQGVEPASD